jgi:predicted Zn-dependent protease
MRLAPAIVIGLLVASCGGGFANSVQGFAADQLIPIEQENALGAQLAAQLEAELQMHSNPEVQAYVRDLGNQVVAVASDRDPGITFRFQVVDDDSTVNAFAIPGGYIYVYTGLLLEAESEAELMAVLSHEVSHVTQRHVAERLVTTYGLETVIGLALGQEPGMISQLVGQVAGTGVLLRHSRSAETEADEVGFGYQVAAGFDPHGFVDFFSKLTGGLRQPEFLSSHPNPENRIEAIQAMIARRDDWPDKTNIEQFQALQQQL